MSELIDNRAHRIRVLKDVIRRLHAGEAPESVQGALAALVKEVDATEIAAMEQQLMDEGMAASEIQSMCDLHAHVLKDVNRDDEGVRFPPGHPGDVFVVENFALKNLVDRMRRIGAEIAALADEANPADLLAELRTALGELDDVDKHYRRKENLLFPVLERHGITGPSTVMWGKDDEVRGMLAALDEALTAGALSAAEAKVVVPALAEPLMTGVVEMTFKEEKILLPMARDTLTEEEWGEIHRQSGEYGWCLVEPRSGWEPPVATEPAKVAALPADHALVFPSGALDYGQILGIFSTLPVDVTFVDAEDRVRFFSEGPDRIFARSRAIVGRKVHHCHPPKSVHVVERIISDFRSGRESAADFWIELHGKFLLIRYFAVRDTNGAYLGTLEVSQDCTRIRALAGERRLLEYDTADAGA